MHDLNLSRRRRLPQIQAAEVAECGLACLAMLSSWHGREISLNALRQRFPPSLGGVTLRGLMQQADGLGLATRAARVDLGEMSQVELPVILYWNHNHFVVLRRFDKRGATIHDPASGVRHVKIEEFTRSFSGVILELEPAIDFEPGIEGRRLQLRDLATTVEGLGKSAWTVIGLSLALQVLVFAAPLQIQFVLDNVLARGDASLILTLAVAFTVLIFFQAALEYVRGWSLQALSYTALYQVMTSLIRHMTRLPLRWFEARTVGDIISRISSANAIQETLTRGVLGALLDGLMGVAAGLLLLAYSPLLATFVFIGVGINAVINHATYRPLQQRVGERIAASASEQSHLMETIRAAATIKTMGREHERVADWGRRYAAVVNGLASVAKYRVGIGAAQTLVNGIQVIIVVSLGASMVIRGEGFSAGMLVAFLGYRQLFSDRVTVFLNQIVEFRLLGLHLDRLSDIVQAPPETASSIEVSPFETKGDIVLDRVSFRYGYSDRPILENISLSVSEGDFIAITGPSGGGKTTLLKILVGLLEPTDGDMLLEGAPANAGRWREWRRQVGVVSQDDRLLAGTIAENVAFFDPNLDMQRVQNAARQAGILADIQSMPMQFLTRVGDMGSSLSSGQKQRLFIARALYAEPRVLVMDEGTANLDDVAEDSIAKLVSSMSITRIVVAHRPRLIEAASRHFVLRAGELVETSVAGARAA